MKKKSCNNNSTGNIDKELCYCFQLVKTVESELNIAHGILDDNVFAKLQSALFRSKDIQQSSQLMKDGLSDKQAT